MTEDPHKQFIQCIAGNFLDIIILRLIQAEPMWGYKIVKKTKRLFRIRLSHSDLYHLLNNLETEGYTQNKKITKEVCVRKFYEPQHSGKNS